jgi:hypothetical protein
MKKVILLLALLLILPVAAAETRIQLGQGTYNLGNRIKASVSVMQPANFEGLFKLTLSCGNYKLQYFLTPASLEANFMTALDVPEVAATPSMLGDCTIIGDLLTNDNLIVEEKVSSIFTITDKLTVLPIRASIIALPGESVQIAGVLNEAFGNNVLKAATQVRLGNISHDLEALDGKFNLTMEIPKNIKSGKHAIEIKSFDSKSNLGSSSIELGITAIPSYIKTELSSATLLPGSKVEITPSLYDQADDLINTSIELELTSPADSKVFTKVVQSNEKIEYEFSQYAEPGQYALESSYKGLHDYDLINITAIREVKIKFSNETVFIENTGNIPFIDELTFFLESETKKYPVLKKINVDPGKILNIDLSKEVPLGIYDVLLPVKEGLEPVKESFSEKTSEAADSASSLLPEKGKVLADGVTIHDNRPIYKKVASGIGSISGALVGSDGILAKNPLIAPITLVVIILLLVFRYGRRPIMNLIKGKKDGKKEDDS